MFYLTGFITLPPAAGELAGDPIRFSVYAIGNGESARGSFAIVHLDDAGGLYAYVVGDITCASFAGDVAMTTGVIRGSWFRDFPGRDVSGTDVAITVADRGADDALGFDYEFLGSTITPCEERTPVFPIERGGFAVR